MYKPVLDPCAGRGIGIICAKSKVPHLHEFARRAGVEVVGWGEGRKDMVVCNPPYFDTSK